MPKIAIHAERKIIKSVNFLIDSLKETDFSELFLTKCATFEVKLHPRFTNKNFLKSTQTSLALCALGTVSFSTGGSVEAGLAECGW